MGTTRPICLVCTAVEGRYKCPLCEDFTCSLPCSREHRGNHPPVEKKPTLPVYIAEAEQSAPSNPTRPTRLSDIVDTTEYKNLLRRYPDMEKYLWSIATATDPPRDDHVGRTFRKPNQPWTKEAGMTNAVHLVQSIKTSPGDVRDAIREFSDLVTIYKAKMKEYDEQVRTRRAEDAQIISSLLRKEKA
ncbi:hypothetical protein F4808DRAFT_236621 [Astrocystis sublimbata]|nr:hypothetical protein F4808DRAFT_236621 [Astrocystis sublimbata]